eukprot:2341408-Prymnesium_polylepis.2
MAALALHQHDCADNGNDDYQQTAEHDGHHDCDVAAILTPCFELVKVHGVRRSITELASRPVVANVAVAITLVTRIDTTRARRPITGVFAAPHLERPV